MAEKRKSDPNQLDLPMPGPKGLDVAAAKPADTSVASTAASAAERKSRKPGHGNGGNGNRHTEIVAEPVLAPVARPPFDPNKVEQPLHRQMDHGFLQYASYVVGHAMQYHPHGDASIADALVVLTNKRYVIEGQGNFGNIYTGDLAAAPRYIECRLTALARAELFNDELTDFVPSYDGRNQEPVVLPSKLPLLLMLGTEGIAVGLSCRILPHNFPELLAAQIAILKKEPFKVLPDFPTGGLMDARAYADGKGGIKARAKLKLKDESTVVIQEIPPTTATDSLIASIEDAARKGKLKVKSVNDFTSEKVEI